MGTQTMRFRRKNDGSMEERSWDSDDFSPPWYDRKEDVPPLGPMTYAVLEKMSDTALRTWLGAQGPQLSRDALLSRAKSHLPPARPMTPPKPPSLMDDEELADYITGHGLVAPVNPVTNLDRGKALEMAAKLEAAALAADKASGGGPTADGARSRPRGTTFSERANEMPDRDAAGPQDGASLSGFRQQPSPNPDAGYQAPENLSDAQLDTLLRSRNVTPAADRDAMIAQVKAFGSSSQLGRAAASRSPSAGSGKSPDNMTEDELRAFVRSRGKIPDPEHAALLRQAQSLA